MLFFSLNRSVFKVQHSIWRVHQLISILSMFSAAPHMRLVQDGCSRRPLGRGGPPPAGPRYPGSTGGRRLHHARHAHRTHHGARLHGRREGGRHDQTRLGLRQLITRRQALFSQFEITSKGWTCSVETQINTGDIRR